MILHNKKATYHKLKSSSRIDHIYSNCAGKITNLRTIQNGMSDHCLINYNYRTKNVNIHPKFAFHRDKHLLTKYSLENYFENNMEINYLFNSQDPNVITNILKGELNNIINILAPKKGSK